MNKTWVLLKANLSDSFSLNKWVGYSAKPRTVLMALLVLFAVGSIAAVVSAYYWLTADVFFEIGMQDSFMMMIALAGAGVSFFLALYKAPGYLYAARDFNLLAALPVKPGAILGSKLLALYVTGFLFAFLLTLPGIIVYGIKADAGPVFYIAGLAATLMLPLVPLIIGAAVAFPIMYISTKFRYANMVTLVLYLVLFVALIVGSYAIPMQTPEQMEAGALMFSNITRFYPPALFYTDALVLGDITSWFMLTVVSVVLPGFVVVLFAKSYLKINTALSERYTRSNFTLERVAVSGVFGALLGKEAKLYFSSPMYVMNTAAGLLMYLIYVVALVVMGFETVAMFMGIPGGDELMMSISAVVAMFCVGICVVTAPSISMEGNGLWIIKTLPVRFWDIAKAKIAFNLVVTVPVTVVATAILAVAVGAGFMLFVGLTLALTGFCLFMAVAGLIANLYFPKLDWKNPTQAVKQSASVLITICVGVVVTCLCGVGFYFSGLTLGVFAWLMAGVFVVLAWGLTAFLKTKGRGLFDDL